MSACAVSIELNFLPCVCEKSIRVGLSKNKSFSGVFQRADKTFGLLTRICLIKMSAVLKNLLVRIII